MWTRRELLVGGTALSVVSLPALAKAKPDLAAEMRSVLMGFDVGDVTKGLLAAAGVPKQWQREVDVVLAGKETGQGVQSFSDLSDDDDVSARLEEVLGKAKKSVCLLLRLKRLLRQAPQTEAERKAAREWLYAHVGLEMDRYRAAVAELPEGGVLFWGALQDMYQAVGQILGEAFELYVSLALGVRMKSHYSSEYPESYRDLVQTLVDPAVTHFAFAGHGSWSSVSMRGHYVHPDKLFAKWCRRARDEPKKFAIDLAKGSMRRLAGGYPVNVQMPEEDLAELVDILPPGPKKQVVVRYTCGSERYGNVPYMLWWLLPDEIRDEVELTHRGISAREPNRAYEEELGNWLDKRAPGAKLAELPAFGRCLVASEDDTIGYEGLTWIEHFIADPLPTNPRLAAFATHAPEEPEPEPPSDEAAEP
jgi:hypothetical protein